MTPREELEQRAGRDPMMTSFHETPTIPFEHVMIDIETMSLSKHNALILSVGMIEFDPTHIEKLEIGRQILLLPDLEHQLWLGREVSKGTQKFWREQSDAASAHWREATKWPTSLSDMCAEVRTFCTGKPRVWANGTQFDLANLEGLNDQLGNDGVKELWHYQAPRDMRTLCRETPQTRIMPIGDALDIPGEAHEPIYDCISQAWKVWSHWQS